MDCTVFTHYTHYFLQFNTHIHTPLCLSCTHTHAYTHAHTRTHAHTHTHTRTHTHSVPPYSPAPHSWAWGSSSDIWARQPAASLNSTCQAEQKHPPPAPDQWHSSPSLSLPSSSITSSSSPPSSNTAILQPTPFSPCQDRLLSRPTWHSCLFRSEFWRARSFTMFWLFESEMDRFQPSPLEQSSWMLNSIRKTNYKLDEINWQANLEWNAQLRLFLHLHSFVGLFRLVILFYGCNHSSLTTLW